MKTVGGLGGVSVADIVGENEEILRDVEGLAGAEEDVGKERIEEGAAVASGAVEEK